MCESVGKADLLSDYLDSQQSMESVDLLLTYHPSPSLFAFRSSEVRHLLLDLDPYGGMFPLFLKRTDVMALRLSVVFRRLVHLGSLPACWRHSNVTPIPKDPLSSSVANYMLISITSVLSKVFECQVSVHLGRCMECCDVLPSTQFACRKGLGTCEVLLCVSPYTAFTPY